MNSKLGSAAVLKCLQMHSNAMLLESRTHTCSETSYRITDVECISRAKNNPVKSARIDLEE